MLNKDNLYPLYIQVKRKIIEEINNGSYTDGSRLPSETELCDKYEVSRITIRRSLQDLVDSGYLVRKQGKGTFVKTGKIERSLIAADGYSEYMKKVGEKPERKIIKETLKPCSSLIAKRLSVPKGSDILELGRIMYFKGVPFGYEISSYPVNLFSDLETEINDQMSMHELFEKKIWHDYKKEATRLSMYY
ncbi:transcriptional regulator, GntR family [Sporolactobacillus inulinus]|uniref:Transcriptional regulator, GntR family n=1 Tax=Sporolactobacillus inulinus TaxID=2078 RepID=A0A4Y1Z8S7_9BACL|nr:GntR family transcriptional regulator [Sporolactobacillus inulinus]GAY75457.1 transcriptional regulator, GntR family [Sporolactobacillus inulinus]